MKGSPVPTTSEAEDRSVHPWVGLRPYDEADQAWFHGRDREIAELTRLVQRETLTVVFGPSGVGKSSLLAAGVYPRLREAQLLPVPLRLDAASLGSDPVPPVREQVERCAKEAGFDVRMGPGLSDAPRTLWEYAHRLEVWTPRNDAVTPVFVIDQFEEVFTVMEGNVLVDAVLAQWADVAENQIPAPVEEAIEKEGRRLPFDVSRPRAKVILVVREDFVARLDGLRRSMPSVMRNRFPLARLDGKAALRAVLKPGGHLVDEDVAREIVRFVAAADRKDDASLAIDDWARTPVEPALLSMICRELNNRRLERGDARLTLDLVAQEKDQILRVFYRRAFEGLPRSARRFVEQTLLTVSGYRRTVPTEDAVRAGLAPQHLQALVQRRLLRIEHRLSRPHVEISHDVLASVVREGQAARRRRRRIRLASAGALLVLATIGLATWMYLVSVESERNAEAARRNAEAADRNARAAERSLEQARATFDFARTTMDALTDEMWEGKVFQEPGLQGVKRQLLDHAEKFYRGLLQQKPDDFEIERRIARIFRARAPILMDTVSFAQGVAEYTAAISHFRRLHERRPEDTSLLTAQADAEKSLARALTDAEDWEAVDRLLESAERNLEQVLARDPADLRANEVLSWTLQWQALSARRSDPHRALDLLQRAVRGVADVCESGRCDDDLRRALLAAHLGLGGLYQDFLGQPADARKEYETAKAIGDALIATDPDVRRNLAVVVQNLGDLDVEAGDLQGAVSRYQEAVGHFRELVSRNPGDMDYVLDLTSSLTDSARVQSGDEALQTLDEVIDLLRKVAARDDARPILSERLVDVLVSSAARLARADRKVEADSRFEEAASIVGQLEERAVGDSRASARLKSRRARLLETRNAPTRETHEEARKLYREAEELDPTAAEFANGGAWEEVYIARLAGDPNERIDLYRNAIPDFQRALALQPQNIAARRGMACALLESAGLQADLDRSDEAASSARQAWDLWSDLRANDAFDAEYREQAGGAFALLLQLLEKAGRGDQFTQVAVLEMERLRALVRGHPEVSGAHTALRQALFQVVGAQRERNPVEYRAEVDRTVELYERLLTDRPVPEVVAAYIQVLDEAPREASASPAGSPWNGLRRRLELLVETHPALLPYLVRVTRTHVAWSSEPPTGEPESPEARRETLRNLLDRIAGWADRWSEDESATREALRAEVDVAASLLPLFEPSDPARRDLLARVEESWTRLLRRLDGDPTVLVERVEEGSDPILREPGRDLDADLVSAAAHVVYREWDARQGAATGGDLEVRRPLIDVLYALRRHEELAEELGVYQAMLGRPHWMYDGSSQVLAVDWTKDADGDRVVFAADDGNTAEFRVGATDTILRRLVSASPVRWAAYAHGGTRVVALSEDGSIRSWDPEGREEDVVDLDPRVVCADVDGRGTRLATGSEPGSVRVHDLVADTLVANRSDLPAPILAVAVDPEGKRLACVDGTGGVHVLSPDLAEDLRPSSVPAAGFTCVAWSSDGTRIACGGEQGVWILDATTLKPIGATPSEPAIPEPEVRAVGFSPDDRRLFVLVAAADQSGIWSTDSWKLTLRIPWKCRCAAFTADGRELVVGDEDGDVHGWPTRTIEEVRAERMAGER